MHRVHPFGKCCRCLDLTSVNWTCNNAESATGKSWAFRSHLQIVVIFVDGAPGQEVYPRHEYQSRDSTDVTSFHASFQKMTTPHYQREAPSFFMYKAVGRQTQ
jgi:hypothetical protein